MIKSEAITGFLELEVYFLSF